jgi:hypothetical protein
MVISRCDAAVVGAAGNGTLSAEFFGAGHRLQQQGDQQQPAYADLSIPEEPEY